MDENEMENLDALDARFGESPLRARMRALLAENERLRDDVTRLSTNLDTMLTAGARAASKTNDVIEEARSNLDADEWCYTDTMRPLLALAERLLEERDALQAGLNDANAHAVEFRGEANDFVLHHTCDGCGAPRLQGPCSKHCDNDD